MSTYNQNRIAVIPARGGSKRILKKNIKDFCGKPIILYVLDTAIKSGLFDKVHVSTDDPEIADIVRDFGVKIDFMRDSKLSDDYTPLMPVLKWVLKKYLELGKQFNEVTLITPCAVFIESSDLIGASNLFQDSLKDCPVLAVSAFQTPIEWAFRIDENGLLRPRNKELLEKRSQDLQEHYYDTGSFAFFSSQYILNSNNAGISTQYIGYVLEKYKAIDIDNIEDWKYAEFLMRGLNKNSF